MKTINKVNINGEEAAFEVAWDNVTEKPQATTEKDGLLSKEDKVKIDKSLTVNKIEEIEE